MGTTPTGLPYPEPTDPVAAGAAAIRDLAEAISQPVPWFRAIGGAGQNIFTGAFTRALWTTIEHNDGGYYAAGIFTCPAAYQGRWRFDYNVLIQAWNGGARQATMQAFTGTAFNYGFMSTTSTDATIPNRLGASADIVLATGHTVDVIVYQDAGTLAINGDTGSYFQGRYVGPR